MTTDPTAAKPAAPLIPPKPGRAPIFTVDERGKEIVQVPLAGAGGVALVDREDWERLMARRISPNWYLNGTGGTRPAHVRVDVKRTPTSVARLILGANAHARTVYANDDRRDLRRSNISLKKVAAKGEGEGGKGVKRVRRRTEREKSPSRIAFEAQVAKYNAESAARQARFEARIAEAVARGVDAEVARKESERVRQEEIMAYLMGRPVGTGPASVKPT
ncbi:hypothetical protein KXR53_01470 [Inquilinus limosus]|uniref:hypothetical protein n=1 Tax=Inquilinus limosus TaxID=171674 RepID=UPI003F1353B8